MKKYKTIKLFNWWIVLTNHKGLVRIFNTESEAAEYCTQELTRKYD